MKTHPSRFRGFTIVELMVSLGITAMIVIALVSITSVAVDSWRRSRGEVRAARLGQAAIESIARDLEGLVIRTGNPFQWLDVEVPTNLPGDGDLSSANAAKLVFFTAATDRYDGKIGTADDKGGDVSAAIYELEYQDPIDPTGDSFPTFVLYRRLINPDETFEKLLGQEDLQDVSIIQDGASASPSNFLCENIYQYTLTFLVEVTGHGSGSQNSTIERIVISESDGTQSLKISGSQIEADGTVLTGGRLRGIEVGLTVLTDTAIQGIRAGRPVNDEFLAQNSYQYSKTIEIPRP